MATIRVRGKRLTASGAVDYQATAEFSKACHEFMAGAGHAGGAIDLSGVTELVSSALAALYDGARLHRPSDLTLIVPQRLELLFAPGEVEGLFTVKTAG
jgi:anti-anti-sigma regulatory factor